MHAWVMTICVMLSALVLVDAALAQTESLAQFPRFHQTGDMAVRMPDKRELASVERRANDLGAIEDLSQGNPSSKSHATPLLARISQHHGITSPSRNGTAAPQHHSIAT